MAFDLSVVIYLWFYVVFCKHSSLNYTNV
jgi:hypothetical protein